MNSKAKPADTIESPRRDPRLPPGQILTEKWPVLQHGEVPRVDIASWDLRVHGLVEHPLHWNYDQFREQPRVQVRSDIHCVTRWTRYNNIWDGVSVKEVLRQAVPRAEVRFAVLHADPGYTTNLPIEELLEDDVLLADLHDGEPLTPEHGYPVRLVVPRRYFWKSAKWIRAIELFAEDRPGFWEQNGYHNEADPWKQERFSDW